jgi:C-terminal processing protease CtpA/Prc
VILVNQQTASAAELLALLLKNRQRATIIGTKTYGAGNPVELFKLVEGYSVYIPISTIVDSITGKGFEKTGVSVDVNI